MHTSFVRSALNNPEWHLGTGSIIVSVVLHKPSGSDFLSAASSGAGSVSESLSQILKRKLHLSRPPADLDTALSVSVAAIRAGREQLCEHLAPRKFVGLDDAVGNSLGRIMKVAQSYCMPSAASDADAHGSSSAPDDGLTRHRYPAVETPAAKLIKKNAGPASIEHKKIMYDWASSDKCIEASRRSLEQYVEKWRKGKFGNGEANLPKTTYHKTGDLSLRRDEYSDCFAITAELHQGTDSSPLSFTESSQGSVKALSTSAKEWF